MSDSIKALETLAMLGASLRDDSVHWNPYNKVVQSHRDGTIDHAKTNETRERLGLPVPWRPEMGEWETRLPPVFGEVFR